MSKVTESKLTEKKSREIRDMCMARIDVLERVKELFLIPELEALPMSKVAEFYEVDVEAVKKCYQRNKAEIDIDGTIHYSVADVVERKGQHVPTVKTQTNTTFFFDNDIEVVVPNSGIKLFSKRAILRIGMLLRDSEIAKEVRTQLLNVFEHASDTERTIEIGEEIQLEANIGKALVTGNMMEFAEACAEAFAYKNRHINALQAQIKENAPKVEFAEHVASDPYGMRVREFAKICCDNGIETGEKRLYKFLRENGFLDENNIPYQRYINQGYFKVKEVSTGMYKPTKAVTRITGKGQQYLLRKLKSQFCSA